MVNRRLTLWAKEEYRCPTDGSFIPFVYTYEHEDSQRNAILIVPGGAYRMVAAGEGDLVAKRFYEEGYNSYVLVYTCALFDGKPVGLQPLRDLAKAVSIIRGENHKKMVICGFSAGGHLAASLGVHWNDPKILPGEPANAAGIRPDAEILCYPVITSGEYGHKDSFAALFGPEPSEEELLYASVEKNVTSDTPSTFLWHTVTDTEVPVENTLKYTEALRHSGVSFELHLFPSGPHGYSLANREWADGKYGGYYTMEQFFSYMQYHIDRQIPLPGGQVLPSKGTDFRAAFQSMPKDYLKAEENPAVAVWPVLAVNWLKSIRIIGESAGNDTPQVPAERIVKTK